MVAASFVSKKGRKQFQAVYSQLIFVTATVDPVTLDTNESVDVDVTGVTGASIGDIVEVVNPYDMTEVLFQAYVSADAVITLTLFGPDTGDINLASGTWKFLVKRIDSANFVA